MHRPDPAPRTHFSTRLGLMAALAAAGGLLASPAAALQASSQTAQSFSIDASLDLVRVSNPQLSPDGERVLFTRSELDWDENEYPSRLWLANADGTDARPFTSEEGDGSARWSPDGRWISFTRSASDGGRGRQVYLIRSDGGEAQQFTRHPSSVSSYDWLPDASGIVFVASDTLTSEERREREKGADAVYVDEGPSGQRRGEWTNVWVVELDSGRSGGPAIEPVDARPVTEGERRIGGFSISPDGRRVAFTYRTENHRNEQFRSEIAVVEIGTEAPAEIRRLTHNEAPESQVEWSPDGSTLTFVAPDLERWKLAQGNLYALELSTGEFRRLADGFEGDLRGYRWAPDGRSIDLVALERTEANFYRLDLATDQVRRLSDLRGIAGSPSWSVDHSLVAFTLATPTRPNEIRTATYPELTVTAVTDVNPGFEGMALSEPETVRWESADGLEVEGLLFLPPGGGGGPHPLVLEIHGGPAGVFSRGFNQGAQILAAEGYAILQPNVRGSSGYGDDLLRGNMFDIGGGDYDDVMTGVDAMIERGAAHPDSLAVKGWSYGGILGGWTITQTDRFRAASLGAMVADWRSEFGSGFHFDVMLWYLGGDPWSNRDFWIERSPYTHADRVTTPTILFHGDEDTTDTVEQTLNFHAGLRHHGVEVRTLRFPRAGHGLSEPRHQRIRYVEELRWFERHVRENPDWEAPERKTSDEGGEGSSDPG